MEKSDGSLSLNFQSRGIAKKTGRCSVALDSSCAAKNEAAAAACDACQNGAAGAAVRVVQIFNPVLVRTDVANFRVLVQKLTGKSGCSKYMWDKLRRLSYSSCDQSNVAQLRNDHAHVLEAEHTHECYGDGHSALQNAQDDQEEGMRSCSLKRCGRTSAAAPAAGAFSELDICAGLVSDGPLPDITMLPPLPHVRSELSLRS